MISRSLRAFSWILAGALTMGSVAQAAEPIIVCDEAPRADVNSKKKMLKAHTSEFWRLIESKVPSFPAALQRKGIVVGDFHFSNLGLYFDPILDSPRLSLNDLDDSGNNYLIGDLLKFLVYLRAVDKKGLELKDVVNAYTDSLAGKSIKAPKEIRELMDLKAPDFAKQQSKYLGKRKNEVQKFNSTSLTNDQKQMMEKIENLTLFQGLTDLQKWVQTSDSGSSAGMDRYLYLASSKTTGAQGLIEFKTLKCSATGNKRQQNLAESFKLVTAYLDQLNQQKAQDSFLGRQRVLFMNEQFVLFREKQPNVLNDLEIESADSNDLQKYAEFYAGYLGFIHSGSADNSYRESVRSNRDLILDLMKPLMSDFKKRVGDDN